MLFTLKSILLGIVQGLTEFIPVSSSGHLVLSNYFLNFDIQDITFDVMLHVGTVLAVILYFRKDIKSLLISLWKFNDRSEEHIANRRIMLLLIIGTVVTGVIGLSVKGFIEAIFYEPLFSAIMIMITGCIIFTADFIKDKKIEVSKSKIWRIVIIGISQSFALLPGISRSGSTITASLAVGIKRDQAARFSFLLSIPAILGAALLDIRRITSVDNSLYLGYFLGTAAAFISGYLVISFLLNLIKKRKLRYISFYCWAIATFSIIMISLGY